MKDDILKPGELAGVGKRLIMVREHLGLKQKQMAADLDLSSSYISDIEKGKSNPAFNFLMRLYRKYRVSLDWLLFEEGDMFCGIGLKEKGRLPEFDFGDQTERVIEMLDIMDKSPFFLTHIISQYIKSSYENDKIISKELEKYKEKK
jgi:transcriptional regulator with XRE-family HTH domain